MICGTLLKRICPPIMRQLTNEKGGLDMWKSVQWILFTLVGIVTVMIIISVFASLTDLFGPLGIALIVLGIVLALVGFFTNVTHNSPVKVGTISRAEFYGVMIALAGWIFQVQTTLNGRIDQIMLELVNMK